MGKLDEEEEPPLPPTSPHTDLPTYEDLHGASTTEETDSETEKPKIPKVTLMQAEPHTAPSMPHETSQLVENLHTATDQTFTVHSVQPKPHTILVEPYTGPDQCCTEGEISKKSDLNIEFIPPEPELEPLPANLHNEFLGPNEPHTETTDTCLDETHTSLEDKTQRVPNSYSEKIGNKKEIPDKGTGGIMTFKEWQSRFVLRKEAMIVVRSEDGELSLRQVVMRWQLREEWECIYYCERVPPEGAFISKIVCALEELPLDK